MSFKATRWAWDAARDDNGKSLITGPARLVLLSLADHADEEGFCYPSHARVAKRTGLARRTAQRGVEELEAAGLVKVTPARTDGGGWTSNRYRLHVPMVRESIGSGTLSTPNGQGDATLVSARRTPYGHSGALTSHSEAAKESTTTTAKPSSSSPSASVGEEGRVSGTAAEVEYIRDVAAEYHPQGKSLPATTVKAWIDECGDFELVADHVRDCAVQGNLATARKLPAYLGAYIKANARPARKDDIRITADMSVEQQYALHVKKHGSGVDFWRKLG